MTEFFPLDDFSLSTDYNGQQKHSTAIRDWITTLPLDDDEAMVVALGWVGRRKKNNCHIQSPPTYLSYSDFYVKVTTC